MKNLKLFATRCVKDIGERVAKKLGITLSNHKEKYFADGEVYTASLENVRSADVFILTSIYGDEEESVNDKLAKLLIFVGSLKDASAERVSVVFYYMPYLRQDRKVHSREPITTKYLANMIKSVGVNRVLTIDPHNSTALQNAFSINIDILEASGLFAKFVADLCRDKTNITILSPDEGRLKASRRFRKYLQDYLKVKVDIACVDKIHDNDDIHANGLIGNIKDKRVVIYDDMISSGKTILEAVNLAKINGACCVEAVCATHGLFVGQANEFLDNDFLKNIVITDTIKPFRLTNPRVCSKISIINTCDLFAEAICRTHKGESISDLIEKNGIPLTYSKLLRI